MTKHKWTYVRTNSKGENIFRKETNESLDFVCNYLLKSNIHYEINKAASLLVVHNKIGKEYMYYWTTGRWSPRKIKYNKHYHSDGIEDFVKKYLNRNVRKTEEIIDDSRV